MLAGFSVGRVGREEAHVGSMFRDELAHSLSQNGTDQNVRVKDDGALGHHRLGARTPAVMNGRGRTLNDESLREHIRVCLWAPLTLIPTLSRAREREHFGRHGPSGRESILAPSPACGRGWG